MFYPGAVLEKQTNATLTDGNYLAPELFIRNIKKERKKEKEKGSV